MMAEESAEVSGIAGCGVVAGMCVAGALVSLLPVLAGTDAGICNIAACGVTVETGPSGSLVLLFAVSTEAEAGLKGRAFVGIACDLVALVSILDRSGESRLFPVATSRRAELETCC